MQRVAQCSSGKEVAQKIWTMESDDQQLNTYCVVWCGFWRWWMLDGEEEEQSKCWMMYIAYVVRSYFSYMF